MLETLTFAPEGDDSVSPPVLTPFKICGGFSVGVQDLPKSRVPGIKFLQNHTQECSVGY